MLKSRRTHVVLPDQLLKEIDSLVGSRQRSNFLSEAAEKELLRRRQLRALDALVAWKDVEHPELKQGSAKYVRKLRREYDQRLKKVTDR
jgi:metal-responsive CopG/Arc/MetJ family transcriptional regulator